MTTRIAVVGLGYVGLNLAVGFGYTEEVIGYDINPRRIEELKKGFDRYGTVSHEYLSSAHILYSDKETCLQEGNFYIIAVPTPVNRTHKPDFASFEAAAQSIGKYLKKNDVVVNESTVYPGATEEMLIPILEKESGLKSGIDFFVGYSPERINPGDELHTITRIKKIISAQNPIALEKIKAVYAKLTLGGLHVVSSMKVAETITVFENTQRDVNIALLNEFVQLTTALNIDIYEVIEGIRTKWNYLDFAPGFVGGHSISVDPYYLAFKAEKIGIPMRLLQTAREINNNLTYLIARVTAALHKKNHVLEQSSVAVFGLGYKEDVPDFRNNLSFDLVKALKVRGMKVYAHDPHLTKEKSIELEIQTTRFEAIPPVDAIIIVKPEKEYKELGFAKICEKLKNDGCIFDIPGIFHTQTLPREDIHYEVY